MEVRLKRIAFSANDGAIPAYASTFVCKSSASPPQTTGPAPFRVLQHLRLVSNYNAGDAGPGNVYDDDGVAGLIDGSQTIAVGLGDRLRADLYIGGSFATDIALPVNTPPIGESMPDGLRETRTARIRVTELRLGGNSTGLDLDAAVRRAREDLAQVGVRVKLVEGVSVVSAPVVHNAFALVVDPSAAPSYHLQGTIVVNGVPCAVNCLSSLASQPTGSVAWRSLAEELGQGLVQGMSPAFPGLRFGYTEIYYPNGAPLYAFVLVPTPNAEAVISVSPGGSNSAGVQLALIDESQMLGRNVYSQLGLAMWSLNYRDGGATFGADLPGSETVDVFVTPTRYLHLDALNGIPNNKAWGWSYPWRQAPPPDQTRPLLSGLTTIRGKAVDQTDNDPLGTAPAFGHEIIHQISKSTAHDPGSTHLMIVEFPATLESGQSPKRLPSGTPPFDAASVRSVSNGATPLPRLLIESCD